MAPPPPPPPPVGAGMAPPPPPPPKLGKQPPGFKIVPGLGDALHEAMRKISGVEEIPAAAEGVASEITRSTSTPTGVNRPKSWHGRQVPGKPKMNRPLMSEMENRLAKRRDKVDKEAYVSEGPEPVNLPPSGARKPSTTSLDSGRGNSIESGDSRNSLEPGGYRRMSVDMGRKEELMLAKEVRKSSAKMLGRCSPNPIFSQSPEDSPVTVLSESTPPPQSTIPPPSPVVMRYWKQCASTADSGFFGDEGIEPDEGAQGTPEEVIPTWKIDAIEGDETEFPSIANKIKQMEEEAKKPLALFEVPDVKSKMRQTAPAAKWMEAKSKLQLQLDTLITKTSEKMAKYGTIHAREREEFVKDSSSETDFQGTEEKMGRSPSPKEIVDTKVKSLIKCVANEIQKSFSMKAIPKTDGDDPENDEDIEAEDETKEDVQEVKEKNERRNEKKLIKEVKRRQQHIVMEAPIIDFEYNDDPELEPEPEAEETEEEENDESEIGDFDLPPGALNFTPARSKASLMRKISTGRRLPAGVIAKRKASDKSKEATVETVNRADASTSTDSAFTEIELAVAEKLKRKEMLSDKILQTQWDISNSEYELSRLSDNQKADLLTKQISKLKSKQVTKLFKSIDTGILDLSIPLLLPFLSLQARMNLGVDIFNDKFKVATSESKNKMVKETFLDMMIKDITDIALLQEVIERSQEKLFILAAEDERRFAEKIRKKMVNVENDSFELRSSAKLRSMSPVVKKESSPIKCASPVIKADAPKSSVDTKPGENGDDEDIPFGITDVNDESDEEEETVVEKEASMEPKDVEEAKKSDDEGCPTSENDSSSDDDKEEVKEDTEEQKKGSYSESDEGLGKSDDNSSKVEEDAPVEKNKDIKKKILNILQDAKSMDQKRNIRNYGRTFEFQGLKDQLRPVLPNDRRPQKAKRLDTLWIQCTASKQKYTDPPVPCLEDLKARQNQAKNSVPTLEELKNKPRSSVPWTRRGNAQPQKKEILAGEKEVEEFESCRNTLNNSKNEAVATPAKTPETGKAKSDALIPKVTKEKVTVESVKNTPQQNKCAECLRLSFRVCICTYTEGSKLEVENTIKTKEVVEKREDKPKITSTAEVAKVEKAEVKEEESKPKENCIEANKQSRESLISSPDASESESDSEVEWEQSADEEEKVPKKKEPTPEKKPVSIPTKEIPSLLISSPAIRRRGDTVISNTVTVSAFIRLPPPPSFRPPPPPVSPPVPVSKVKDMEKADGKISYVSKKEESSDDEDEEEESEWETSEEEDEDECEVKKEGWENIMSNAQKPTTFKAEYAVRVGGKL